MSEVRIALDAMGVDFFAVPNLQGATKAIEDAQFLKRKLKVFLCAPQDRLLGSVKEAAEDAQVRLLEAAVNASSGSPHRPHQHHHSLPLPRLGNAEQNEPASIVRSG